MIFLFSTNISILWFSLRVLWWNSKVYKTIISVLHQSEHIFINKEISFDVGIPPQFLTNPQKYKYNGRMKNAKKESLLSNSS